VAVCGSTQAESGEPDYGGLRARIASLLDGENDWIAALATVVCEVHHSSGRFHWTGFDSLVGGELVGGPNQGGHRCLRITQDRGICGAAARTGKSQRVDDVHSRPEHIACVASTRSELVVPVLSPTGVLLAVLDIDSDLPAAFSAKDQEELEGLCSDLGRHFASTAGS
jgi:GAF domain-containing protein